MSKSNSEMSRVNINLPSLLVEKVKKYAEETGLNVTSAYIVLLNRGLEFIYLDNEILKLFYKNMNIKKEI